MIQPVTSQDFFGAGIPKVYFNTFTLSYDNGLERSIQDPHIDHPNEKSVPTLSQITDSNKNKTLHVKINLILKETLDENSKLKYLTDVDITKYIKIKILECRDETLYNTLLSTPVASLSESANNIMLSTPSSQSSLTIKTININESTLNILDSSIYGESLSTSGDGDLVTNQSSMLKNFSFQQSQNADGTITYDIGLFSDFKITAAKGGANIKFLAYIAYAYFDVSGFSIDNDVFGKVSLYSAINSVLGLGPVSSEIVLQDGKPYQNSYAFIDSMGNYYLGDVHKMSEGDSWMKGISHPSSPKPTDFLTKIDVPNSKVIDNRQKLDLEKINLDYVAFSNFFTNDEALLRLTRQLKTSNILEKKPKMFSELFLSRDKKNNARFLFTFNMHEALRNNTMFPALLDIIKSKDKTEYLDIISSAKILDFKILRQKVKSNEVLDSQSQRTSFSKTDNPFLVVNSVQSGKELLANKIFTKKNTKSLPTPVPVGSIRPISFLVDNNMGLKSFCGTDYDIRDRLGGMYQYSVEMTIADPLPTFLRKKLTEIAKARKEIENYYNDAISSPSYYDVHTDRFTSTFHDFYLSKYGAPEQFGSFLTGAISSYIETLVLLASEDTESTFDAIRVLAYMVQISSPNQGNPNGIQLVVKIIEDFMFKLKSVLSSTLIYKTKKGTQSNASNALKDSTGVAPTKAKKSFKLVHHFKNLYDASIPQAFGADFISLTKSDPVGNLDGLKSIEGSSMKQRTFKETQKYFKALSADISIKDLTKGSSANTVAETIFNKGDSIDNRRYAYLSPSYIRVPRRATPSILNNGSLNQSRKELNDLVLDIFRFNQSNSSIGTLSNDNVVLEHKSKISSLDQKRRFDLVNLLATKGCTITVQETINPPKDTEQENKGSSGALFGLGIPLLDPLGQKPNLFLPNKDILASSINPNDLLNTIFQLDDLNLQSEENNDIFYNVEKSSGGTAFKNELFGYALTVAFGSEAPPPLSLAPNQLKALMLSILGKDEVVNDKGQGVSDVPGLKGGNFLRNPQNFGFSYFNYKYIMGIEALRGYSMVGDEIFVGDPIFSPLTSEDIENLSDSPLLCRLKRYEKKLYGYNRLEQLEVPVYDEYFLVYPNNQLPTSLPTPDFAGLAEANAGIGIPATGGGININTVGGSSTPVSFIGTIQSFGTTTTDSVSDFKLRRDKYVEQRVLNFEPKPIGGSPRQGTRGMIKNEYIRSSIVGSDRTLAEAGIQVDRMQPVNIAKQLGSLGEIQKAQMLRDMGIDPEGIQGTKSSAGDIGNTPAETGQPGQQGEMVYNPAASNQTQAPQAQGVPTGASAMGQSVPVGVPLNPNFGGGGGGGGGGSY